MDFVSNTFQLQTGHGISRRQLLQRAMVLTGAAMLPAGHRAGIWNPTTVQAAAAGYADLHIQVADDGFTLPQNIPAGRYMVTLDNPRDEGITVTFIQPPPDKTAADLQQTLRGEQDPAWLYDAVSLGGPYAIAESSAQGIVDLAPGAWLVSGGQSLAGPAQWLTVTEPETPAAAAPQTNVTLTMQEYGFADLASDIAPGSQIWKFTNRGQQPHLMDLVRIAHPVTVSDVIDFLALPDDAAPSPGRLSAADVEGVAGIGTTSPGQTVWLVLPDLSPGTYAAMCFVPDRELGTPHAMMGMVQVFTVTDAAATAPVAGIVIDAGQTLSVDIHDFAFTPAVIEVAVGDTVTWTNRDAAPHTVTGETGSDLASGTVAASATFSHTFTSGGSFTYKCDFHPSMTGSVVVQ